MKRFRRFAAICTALALLVGSGALAERNVLMKTQVKDIMKASDSDRGTDYILRSLSTLGNEEVFRFCVRSITFLDSLRRVPRDAWDASQDGDGSVLAWVEPCPSGVELMQDPSEFFDLEGLSSFEPVDLYIAARGPVSSGSDASFTFMLYINLEEIHFDGNYDVSDARKMCGMFLGCMSLSELDLSDFDTARVRDMWAMFCACSALRELDLNAFRTENVTDMSYMFGGCSQLERLDLSSFSTERAVDLRGMFRGCERLSDLRSSAAFVLREGMRLEDMFAETRFAGEAEED